MFRYFLVPVIIGSLVYLSIYFVLPEFFSESSIVSFVAQLLLSQSNLYFNPMPAILVSYIAGLDLLIIAFTGAILSVAITGLVVIISTLSIAVIRGLILLFRKKPKSEKAVDLAPINLEPQTNKFAGGKKIVGKGFDSVDRV